MVRNPIAVVTLVRSTGSRLIRKDSVMASSLDLPKRICWNIVTKIWILSATAKVRMIVGALIDAGLIAMRSQPANPIPVIMEMRIMSRVASVPVTDCSESPVMIMSVINMIGMTVAMSLWLTSPYALSNMTAPER